MPAIHLISIYDLFFDDPLIKRRKIYSVRRFRAGRAQEAVFCRSPRKSKFRQMQEFLVQKEPGTYDFWLIHVYPHMK